jgi:hypothetical protein
MVAPRGAEKGTVLKTTSDPVPPSPGRAPAIEAASRRLSELTMSRGDRTEGLPDCPAPSRLLIS